MDSEGIDAVSSEGSDDHCIFTLIILLASVFIYNSAGVPTRTDLDGLQYLLMLFSKYYSFDNSGNFFNSGFSGW